MFRDQVRQFAEARGAAAGREDGQGGADPAQPHRQVLRARDHGDRDPGSDGGAGATFFMSVLVVEELARVDASVAVLVDVQNTLVNNALLRWGSE